VIINYRLLSTTLKEYFSWAASVTATIPRLACMTCINIHSLRVIATQLLRCMEVPKTSSLTRDNATVSSQELSTPTRCSNSSSDRSIPWAEELFLLFMELE
jgi:hypothetical protein